MATFVCEKCRLVVASRERLLKHSLVCKREKYDGPTVWTSGESVSTESPPPARMSDA